MFATIGSLMQALLARKCLKYSGNRAQYRGIGLMAEVVRKPPWREWHLFLACSWDHTAALAVSEEMLVRYLC